MSELENPGRDVAVALRSLLLVASRLAELAARRRELILRRATQQSQQAYRDTQTRFNAERKLAEDQLRAVRSTMNALARVDPNQVANAYQTAAAWRGQSALADEVITSVETYMRSFGIDPDQLRAAGTQFARRAEPSARPGLTSEITATDTTLATDGTDPWRSQLSEESRRIGAAIQESGLPQSSRDALDAADRATIKQHGHQTLGWEPSRQVDDTALLTWRVDEATRWAREHHHVADLALFAALMSDDDPVATNNDELATARAQLVALWMDSRMRTENGIAQIDLMRISGSAAQTQLDRAHAWVQDTDADYYVDWSRMRTVDPARADAELVRHFESDVARQWAGELGDDLWKHGFAAAVARDPDADLDDVARRVWTAAGKPAPSFDPAVTIVPIQQRWADQVAAANAWARSADTDAWDQWRRWRENPDHPIADRARGDAELVSDYHSVQAEEWVSAARTAGTLSPAQHPRTPDQMMAAWRIHTSGQVNIREAAQGEDNVLSRAMNWHRSQDPLGHLAWNASIQAGDDNHRQQALEELVHDYETHEARRWAQAAETLAIVPEGTAKLEADEVIAMWRSYTDAVRTDKAQAAQTNTEQPTAGGPAQATQQSEQQAGQSRQQSGQRRQNEKSLADLVRGSVPDSLLARAQWRQAVEPAFRTFRGFNIPASELANAVRKINFAEATKPIGLVIWTLRQTAGPDAAAKFDEARHNPTPEPGTDKTNTTGQAKGAAWDSQQSRDQRAADLNANTNIDPAAARARKLADLAFGTPPRSAVDDATGKENPRTSPNQQQEQQRQRGKGRSA
ncbi:hypothetical protein ACFWPX_29995 [Nocardia sp. NPDC058518]|uniref:hypothetical protein n=1 Tax=Nocardia sp. NPDC058518 TaxID=3346534 RepID=UPI00365DC13E